MKYKPANVRVAHIRYPAEDGSIDNHGGITLAAEIGDNHKVIKFAIAKCHRKDNYVKHIGWNKAVGRVISKNEYLEPVAAIEWRELVSIYRDNAAVGVTYNGVI